MTSFLPDTNAAQSVRNRLSIPLEWSLDEKGAGDLCRAGGFLFLGVGPGYIGVGAVGSPPTYISLSLKLASYAFSFLSVCYTSL